ncbi:MAG TPA: DNA-3-methyladenine glycosylase [Anaeromyxobacteraceae bacterium]|nr:DNA-3-methyladenine glycosylase [Anaeromyxobacteraceae bacterium]
MEDGSGKTRLPRAFYARDTRVVARALLGKTLVHVDGGVRRAARIVETEAYHGPQDLASHARFGPTKRAGIMFGPPGVAYVYLIYGTAHCMNVVTGPEGYPSAVLIRAGEPLEGCLHSTRGPGNLCRALAIRREHDNGRALDGDDLFVLDAPPPREPIVASPRVNVHYAGAWAEKPWRFLLEGNPWVSRPVPSVRPSTGSGRTDLRAARGEEAEAARPIRSPRRSRRRRGTGP